MRRTIEQRMPPEQTLRALGQWMVVRTVTVPAAGAGTLQTVAVTFPAGSFTAAPGGVWVNPIVVDPAQYEACAVAETATGFQLNVRRGAAASSSFPIRYLAVGA